LPEFPGCGTLHSMTPSTLDLVCYSVHISIIAGAITISYSIY
jgi:hypothetical protein